MSKKNDNTAPEAMTPEEIIAQAQAEAEAIRAAALNEASDIRQQAEEEADGIRKEARDAASADDAAQEQAAKPAPKHDEGEEYVEVELFHEDQAQVLLGHSEPDAAGQGDLYHAVQDARRFRRRRPREQRQRLTCSLAN